MIAEELGQLLYDPDCSKCNGEDWEWHTEHEDEDGGDTQ